MVTNTPIMATIYHDHELFGDNREKAILRDGEKCVKCWNSNKGKWYEVYVRMYNEIRDYKEGEVSRYLVRHKYLSEEEKEYQQIGEMDL